MPVGERVQIAHGPTVDDRQLRPTAMVLVSLPAALELAVGIVHAALTIDATETQARMLALWLDEVGRA